jgi:hypothetical protein
VLKTHYENQEAQQILKQALAALLQAIADHDERLAAQEPPGPLRLTFVSAGEFLMTPLPTPDDAFIMGLTTDPVRSTLKDGVRAIGLQLCRLGGLALMQDMADRVERHLEQTAGTDVSSTGGVVINSVWDGIGGWMA